jgi:hypothetical protein
VRRAPDRRPAPATPTVKARERLTAEGRWADCRAELSALAERHNRSADGRLHMEAEYLVTVAPRRVTPSVSATSSQRSFNAPGRPSPHTQTKANPRRQAQ